MAEKARQSSLTPEQQYEADFGRLQHELAKHYIGFYGDIPLIIKLKKHFWMTYGWDKLEEAVRIITLRIAKFQLEE